MKVVLQLMNQSNISSLSDCDLKLLYEILFRHRLLPFANRLFPVMDVSTVNSWKKSIRSLTIRSLHLTSILQRFISELNIAGIDAVPLKGPVLAIKLYNDVGKRHYSDLDVYIPHNQIFQAIRLANKIGFKLIYPKSDISRKQWNYYFRYEKDVILHCEELSGYIELHFGVHFEGLLGVKNQSVLFSDLQVIEIQGMSVSSMNFNNTFLYLTYHGGLHLYSSLVWLKDVSVALSKWQLDHEIIHSRAESIGIQRILFVSLLLSNKYFNSPIPRLYDSSLADNKKVLSMMQSICEREFIDHSNKQFGYKMRRFLFLAMLKSGIKYKLLLIGGIFHRWNIRKSLGGH